MRADHSIRNCQTCAVDKPLNHFHRIRGNPGDRSVICRECIDLANHESTPVANGAPKSRERNRTRSYRRYGITSKQYLELLRRQGGACAICRKIPPEKSLSIDHDHHCCDRDSSCGKCVRGLLCSKCNFGIAMFRDDPELLESAIAYLEGCDPMAIKQRRAAKKRKAKKQVSYMTVPEIERLFKHIDNTRDRAIFRLMYHHGLRAGELGMLDMSDYRAGSSLNLDRINIHRLKGSISGETSVVPTAAQAIRGWIRKRGHTAGPLFISRNRGRITRCRIWQLMQKYCEAAGIPPEKRHPHIMKHTCCTHLVSDKRESIMDVQKHVGHADIASTLIYAELTEEANDARIKRLRDWK